MERNKCRNPLQLSYQTNMTCLNILLSLKSRQNWLLTLGISLFNSIRLNHKQTKIIHRCRSWPIRNQMKWRSRVKLCNKSKTYKYLATRSVILVSCKKGQQSEMLMRFHQTILIRQLKLKMIIFRIHQTISTNHSFSCQNLLINNLLTIHSNRLKRPKQRLLKTNHMKNFKINKNWIQTN